MRRMAKHLKWPFKVYLLFELEMNLVRIPFKFNRVMSKIKPAVLIHA